jgi:hypothetical protein
MRRIWKVNVTRLDGEWFRDGLVMDQTPAVGDEFECQTPSGESVTAEVIHVHRLSPTGRATRWGIFEITAREKR